MYDRGRRDPRNQLWRHFMRILKVVQPKIFLIENVPALLRSTEYASLKRWLEREFENRYVITDEVLNAADFGVPQTRRRAIVVGSRVGPINPFPGGSERRTVRDAIHDLPRRPNGANWHHRREPTEISLQRYKVIPKGGNRFDLMRRRPDLTPRCWLRKQSGSTDVFGRMEWDKPSPTIRTEFYKPEKGRYLHPSAHRPITIREAARLQTFPDEFVFCGSRVQVAKQIGNALPVRMAEGLGAHLYGFLRPLKREQERK
jgi:DNA (cytosine-5)-methyltransferase 1